jgi:hypothetical protein
MGDAVTTTCVCGHPVAHPRAPAIDRFWLKVPFQRWFWRRPSVAGRLGKTIAAGLERVR